MLPDRFRDGRLVLYWVADTFHSPSSKSVWRAEIVLARADGLGTDQRQISRVLRRTSRSTAAGVEAGKGHVSRSAGEGGSLVIGGALPPRTGAKSLPPPFPGQQFNEPALRDAGDPGEHIGQPSLRIDVVELGGLYRPPSYAERIGFP